MNLLQTGGEFNYCNLPPNAKLHFGSGGSKTIIAIVKDKAYKYFPLLIYSNTSKTEIKKLINFNKLEIAIIKELTKKIINTKLSPHIIAYYNDYKCTEIPTTLFNKCPLYSNYLLSSKKINHECNFIYRGEILYKPMYVLEMEKANSSLKDEIIKIASQKFENIEVFLNRLYFQIFYTLENIKIIFPDYIHNDLFIRNILANNNNDDNYIRYHYKNNIFDLPANGLNFKINDFGLTQLDKTIEQKYNSSNPIINNPYRDYFSILYDIYNGNNYGSNSLYNLIKNKNKLEKIDKYFNNFMNISIIKKIIKYNKKQELDWYWNITFEPNIIKLFKIKKFDDLINYFSKIFVYDEKHNIIEEYGKK
jgi:hypothetical protein